jgi:type I restriction enzyme S subunit
MEVKPGYQQTEVGVIPEDWKLLSLGEVVVFLDGKRRPVKDADRARMRGSIPYYGASGIVDHVNDYLFDEDLILLGEDGENILSRNCRLAFRISGKSWVNNHAHVLKPNPGISIGFLTDYLESLNYERFNSGTAQPKLNKQNCLGIPVALPPTKAEQEVIAEVLSDSDALIESLEQLLVKKRHLKQGAIQELLIGKKRLPGFQVKPGFKQTEVGLIPADWEVERLAAICSMKSGEGITSAAIDQFSAYPCYGGNGLRGFTTRFTHDGRYSLVGRQGALCGNVLGVEGNFFASEHAIVVTPSARTDARWLTFVLAEMRLNQYSESSAQPGLSVSKLLSLNVAHPPTKAEQGAIATTLAEMDTEIVALEAKLAKARDLKQGMMQELLTGRIRLV